jgi:hypothetical protein
MRVGGVRDMGETRCYQLLSQAVRIYYEKHSINHNCDIPPTGNAIAPMHEEYPPHRSEAMVGSHTGPVIAVGYREQCPGLGVGVVGVQILVCQRRTGSEKRNQQG